MRGLGIALPPLVTVLILLWVGHTIQRYVLAPVTGGVRHLLVQSLAEIRDGLPQAAPTDVPGVFSAERRLYRRLPRGQFVPWEIYRAVELGPGPRPLPETGQALYRRYVDERYLRPQWVVPIFLVLFLLALYLLGRFLAAGLGRALWDLIERLIVQVPLVRNVYSSVKQVTDFMLSEREFHSSLVVAIEYPKRGVWSLGFVTSSGLPEIRRHAEEDEMISVVVPASPAPVTAYTVMVPRREMIEMNLTADQALQFIISCGVVIPPHQRPEPSESAA